MIHLPIDIEKFGFVQRESSHGRTVTYKCGRDFLYYALHYYAPTKFTPQFNNPLQLEKNENLGFSLPTWLAWTQLQFYTLPVFLRFHSMELRINTHKIKTFWKFVFAILFSRISYESALEKIEDNVRKGLVSGIDVALRWQGLEDHVLFVYGYDEDNLYVFDTHAVSNLEYEKLTTDDRYYMRLPKSVIKKRWKMFSRVWEVGKSRYPLPSHS
jgi:hypothetical protein